MPTPTSIANGWDQYRKNCLPSAPGPVAGLFHDTFHCGAAALLTIINQRLIAGDADGVYAALRDANAEINAFHRSLNRKLAKAKKTKNRKA